MQVKDEIHEQIRNRFVENQIEIPVPKIGFVDRPITQHSALANEDVDAYANAQELKMQKDQDKHL